MRKWCIGQVDTLRVVLGAALLLWAAPLSAQVRGVVADSAGMPLAGATVEVWSADARLAVGLSDESGAFSFSAESASGARGLVLSAMGYRASAVQVSPGDTLVRVRLEAEALPLPELTVLVARQVCPNREEPAARAIWQAARERYASATAARGFAYWANVLRQTVQPDRVGHVQHSFPVLVSRASGSSSFWGGAGGGWVPRRLPLAQELVRTGYAVRNDPESPYPLAEDFFHWFYPALDTHQAHHWVSETFGALHLLSIAGESAGDYLIAFCPRSREHPSIEGTLTVAKDSTLVAAAWSFRTPGPKEEAGGDVVFAPWGGRGDELPHLLPARSTFWRRIGGSKLFYQRSAVFLCWVMSPDASRPPLPTQPPEGERCTASREAE